MHDVHSITQIWPFMDQQAPNQIGGSLLVQPMKQPSLAEARLKTYAWNGPLDTSMHWMDCQTNHLIIRSTSISHALWNTQ